jgi:hypothetical protein
MAYADTPNGRRASETGEERHGGGIGIFQTLGLGLLAFTLLMVLLAIVQSVIVGPDAWFG